MNAADAILYLDDRTTGLLLDRFDPVRTVARALAAPAPGPLCARRAADVTVVATAPTGRVACLISSADLRRLPLGCVVAALARALLRRPVPLVGLLGDAHCEATYLRPLVAALPPGSQLAVCRPGPAPATSVPGGPAVTRRRGGVAVTVTRAAAEALRGADLVIVTAPPPVRLDPRWPAAGAALLDVTGVTPNAGGLAGTAALPWPGVRHRVTRAEVATATTALAGEVYRVAVESGAGTWLPR
ncbi:hypothetical protein [Micromonospora sp. NPDC126480]|uniref:hypothetical protein n=1 Tax=Micromonospora sp. NPDC126480 TaxID=3155312 RepID=UPI003319358B